MFIPGHPCGCNEQNKEQEGKKEWDDSVDKNVGVGLVALEVLRSVLLIGATKDVENEVDIDEFEP